MVKVLINPPKFDKKRQKVQKIIRTISITGIFKKVIHSNKKKWKKNKLYFT